MNFLVVGGAGSVGRDLTTSLVEKGHRVRVLDRAVGESPLWCDKNVELVKGSLDDRPLVEHALHGVDAVIHLAWSFSEDPLKLVQDDLKGHVVLLEASAAARVSRLFYTSTAVVYGKPVQIPTTEDAPCLVEDARKPFYAVAKQAAEKLALAYWRTRGLPVTIIRFWWSFGQTIGGRHLRDMIARAQTGQPLEVPADAGGSFLDHADLTHALLLAVAADSSIGQTFNLATIYLEWRDIAQMIIDGTRSSSAVQVIPPKEWRGAQFLADRWELSTAKAERLFGYRSCFSSSEARQRLAAAIAPT